MGFADTFKALSDPVRREILMLVKNGRMSAGDIGSYFTVSGATISYHLNILKKADLVYEQKEKNYIYYTLNASVVEEIMLWLSRLKGGNEDEEIEGKQGIVDSDECCCSGTSDDRSDFLEETPESNASALGL